MKIKIIDSRLTEDMFSGATAGSAAIDLRACVYKTISLRPKESIMIKAGFAVHINNHEIVGMIAPRSGMGSKGLVLANTVGLIDSDYQGEIMMNLLNRNAIDSIVINPMDRIAQMTFVKIEKPSFKFINNFDSTTERGSGGFGSTGE